MITKKTIISLFITLGFSFSFFLLIDLFEHIIYYQKLVSYDNFNFELSPFKKYSVIRITFAFYTLLLGAYYGLQYFLSKECKWPNRVKNRVLNDLFIFPWIVIYVFSQMIVLFRIFPFLISRNDYINMFMNSVQCIGILLIFMGFIICTQYLRRFSILNLKQTITLFIFIIGLSFLYASVSTVNRDNLEKSALVNNVYFTHKIKVPFSYDYDKVRRKSLVDNYGIAYDTILNKTILFTQNEKLFKEHVKNTIYQSHDSRREEEIRYLTSIFHVDSKLPLDSVLPFLYEFYLHQSSKIAFQTNKENNIFRFKLIKPIFYDYILNDYHFIDNEIDNNFRNRTIRPLSPVEITEYKYIAEDLNSKNSIHLKFTEEGIMHQNILTFDLEKLYKSKKVNKEQVVFYVLVETSQSIQSYIKNKSLIFKLIKEFRNVESLLKYNKPFKDLDRKQALIIKRKHPINMVEFGLKNLSKNRLQAFFEEQKEKE